MAYKHVIRAKRRNLFNKNNATIINGYIHSRKLIITKSPIDKTIVFPCKPNTTYTFSKMYTNRLFMAETSEETPAIGTTCTNPIADLGEPPSQNYCTLTTTATAKNLIITVCALYNTVTYTLQEILDSVQIEEGSTPTPYTPYNYLQSNKRMIKVSNVCQLLDKSKYPATQTDSGVTFTNNGDGTITANGTSTKHYAHYSIIVPRPAIGHKILVLPENHGNTQDHIYVYGCNDKGVWIDDVGYGGRIITITGVGITFKRPYTTIGINLNVNKDWVMNNHIYKPQLFDLTEMFGAGHEPATVAEFRQRFPNELYPYSPQCWLTSYKSAVVCKTKNLFDYKTSAEKTQTNNGITLILNADYFELSGQQQAGKYIELGQSGFNIPFEVGKTYVLSADTIVKSGGKVFMRARYTDGESPLTEWETVSWNLSNGTIAKRFTPTRPGYFDKITFYNASDTIPISGDYIIRIQLEQGSTATSYVPYQHL